MRSLIIAVFILLLFSFGCLNLYRDVISADCYDPIKYPSNYSKIDCLGEKSRYLAAFNEKEQALSVCNEIKTRFVDINTLGLDVGNNFNIFPSHAVSAYNNCIEEVAVFTLDPSICQKQVIPNAFAAIGDAFSSVPGIGESISQQHYKGCEDNVLFRIARQNSLPNLMSNFTYLLTTRPEQR